MKQNNNEQEIKIGFWKKIWYSISKIERYSELAAQGFGKAIKYLIALIILLSLTSGFSSTYKLVEEIKKAGKYIEENASNFNYKDGNLSVDYDNQPIINEETDLGKIIIDTNTEDKDIINQYKSEVGKEKNGIVMLKNKAIIKQQGQETKEYSYNTLLEGLNLSEFNKETIVEFMTDSSKMMSIYATVAVVFFISSLIMYLSNILLNILIISFVGVLATMLLKIKMRYIAIFNMTVYSVTLTTLLYILYIGVNAFVDYSIPYFDVMYIMVSTIYLLAAIFMLKAEMIKKQIEVQKIIEIQKEVKNEMEEQREDKKEDKKEDKEQKQRKKEETDETPEGSNA